MSQKWKLKVLDRKEDPLAKKKSPWGGFDKMSSS
jgi:hypothetical protein